MTQEKTPGFIASHVEILRPGWWLACFFIGLTPGMLAIWWSTGGLDDFFQLRTLLWAFGYWASVVGVYSYNDAVGMEEDAVVNPKRPVPSGRVTKKGALALGAVMVVLGVLAWWLAFGNVVSSALQLASVGLMIVYSQFYKDNVLLSLAAALIPVAVWIAFAPLHPIAIALFVLIFFWEAALDVPENILHLEGDKKAHPHTYAIRLGPERFAKVGWVFAVLTVAAMAWLAYLLDFSVVFLVFAGLSGLILINSQLRIRSDISPMKLGSSLGMVMLSIFLVNIGLIAHALAYSYWL